MTIVESAIQLAAWAPVFPCRPDKRPACPHGFHDATTDPTEIRRLFNGSGALIGIPTGSASGFDVLDVDPRHGGQEWEEQNRHRLPETRTHQTMGGGRHWLFRHVEGVHNSASAIAPGIDVRGEGGYVITPPSPGYSVISDAEIAHWPDWLLAEVLPKTRDPTPTPPPSTYDPIPSKRLEAFVAAVLARVSAAPEGQKHFILRNQAMILGGIAHLGSLSHADLLRRLMDSLPSTVINRQNAEKTAKWGLEMGTQNPLDLPDRQRTNGLAREEPPTPESESGYGTEETAKIAQTAQEPNEPPHKYPLQVKFFNELTPSLDAADFIEGVLIAADMSVVYGPSNSGKSFWTLDLALHAAAGKQWNGREVDRCGVLWLAMEGQHGISNRVVAWREHHAVGEGELPFAVVPVTLNLLNKDADTTPLIQTINAIKDHLGCPVGWVVVDTLSRAIAGGNENAPDDMGALVTNGARIQQETKAHVTWIHHSGKDEAKGARGHSLLRAATGTEIEISAEGSHVARVTKQRELECVGEFPFVLKVVELGTNRRGKPVTSCVAIPPEGLVTDTTVRSVRLKGHARRAMDALNDVLGTSGAAGFVGVPAGIPSVPEKWWRERFYDRTASDGKGDPEKPDISQHGKRTAFNRALSELQDRRLIGVNRDRVWIVAAPKAAPE